MPEPADAELALDRLSDEAAEVSSLMHGAIARIDDLADRLLNVIEHVGGDREHNYSLYADLKNAAQAAYVIHTKAITVARHARVDRPAEGTAPEAAEAAAG